jgi:cytidyltransferase-like protein
MSHVMTLGTFDLLHPGHVKFLDACRKLAGPAGTFGIVTVAVSSDAFVTRWKHRPPVQDQDARMAMIRSLRSVDSVVLNNPGENPNGQRNLILGVKPDVVAIGMDWAARDYSAQLGVDAGFWTHPSAPTLVYLPREAGDWSTTSLVDMVLRARGEDTTLPAAVPAVQYAWETDHPDAQDVPLPERFGVATITAEQLVAAGVRRGDSVTILGDTE